MGSKLFQEMYLEPIDRYGVWIRGIFYKAGYTFSYMFAYWAPRAYLVILFVITLKL